MERNEFNIKIKKLFLEYETSINTDFGSTFLSKDYEPKEYKCPIRDINSNINYFNKNKCTIKELGRKYIYISSAMYPNEERNFWYCIFATKAEFRGYRCKNWNEIEMNKQYFSGKTLNELFNKIESFKNDKQLNTVY